jgi:diguanylate cyclase (GGDEF)-like protein
VKNQQKELRRLANWGRASAVCLTLVLLGGATFGPLASRATNVESADAQRLAQLDRDAEAAVYSLSQEALFEERIKTNPTMRNLTLHRNYANDVDAAIRGFAREGGASQQSIANAMTTEHRLYIAHAARMFAAVIDHRSPSEIARIDRLSVDPVQSGLMDLIDQAEAQVDTSAASADSRLQRTAQVISSIAIGIPCIGLTFLGIFFYVLEAYRRRNGDVHRAELVRLKEAALTDNLTSLGNHRAFQEDLRREIARAVRHDEAVSLALIDIDDLKVVNDSNGHQRGDEVLAALAEILRGLRAEDRAYRVGGDEFAVLLANTSAKDAKAAMERIRSQAQEKLFGATISVGIATALGVDRDVEIMRGQADAALYAAKRAGRNIVEYFHEDKDGMWILSAVKVRNLRQLLAEKEMGVAFQPIWDVDRCNVLAYEALARPADKFGFRGPQDAFDLAARMGRGHELDAICRDAILERAHTLPDDSLLFINVCPETLDHIGFDAATFAKLVVRAGLSPKRVVVEITERAVAKLDTVIAMARELRRHGFRLALDDTGAGNSGLELLSKMPVDFVKIDRMIIVNAVSHAGARGVLAGIIAIAHAIGAYVIAEGIEDEQMLRLVCSAELGVAAGRTAVNGVQGYLLQRPSEIIPGNNELGSVRALLHRVGSDQGSRGSSTRYVKDPRGIHAA